MADSTTLAEIFLGFGSKTLVVMGTSFTAVGTIYGIHKLTGMSISILNNLQSLLSSNNRPSDGTLITRKDLADGFSSFGKIGLLIACGVGLKIVGARMGSNSTVEFLNTALYK